jgi:hypothetical protein
MQDTMPGLREFIVSYRKNACQGAVVHMDKKEGQAFRRGTVCGVGCPKMRT